MSRHLQSFGVVTALSAITLATAMGTATTSAAGAATAGSAATYRVGPITDVSTCGGQNAEVEQAVDPKLGYVYEEWMGCKGIAVARSANGGATPNAAGNMAGTAGSDIHNSDAAPPRP